MNSLKAKSVSRCLLLDSLQQIILIYTLAEQLVHYFTKNKELQLLNYYYYQMVFRIDFNNFYFGLKKWKRVCWVITYLGD